MFKPTPICALRTLCIAAFATVSLPAFAVGATCPPGMSVVTRGSGPVGDKRDVCLSPDAVQIAPTLIPN